MAFTMKLKGKQNMERVLKDYAKSTRQEALAATFRTAIDVEREAKERFVPAERLGTSASGKTVYWRIGDERGPNPPEPYPSKYTDKSGLLPHVRFGNLRRSISHSRMAGEDGYRVVADSKYAAAVEYGSRKMGTRAHPFMFPAAEFNRKKHTERIKKAMQPRGGSIGGGTRGVGT